MDLYWWTNQDNKGISIAKEGLKNKVQDPELGVKLAQAYKRTNNVVMAKKTIDSIIKKYPSNAAFLKIKKTF